MLHIGNPPNGPHNRGLVVVCGYKCNSIFISRYSLISLPKSACRNSLIPLRFDTGEPWNEMPVKRQYLSSIATPSVRQTISKCALHQSGSGRNAATHPPPLSTWLRKTKTSESVIISNKSSSRINHLNLGGCGSTPAYVIVSCYA